MRYRHLFFRVRQETTHGLAISTDVHCTVVAVDTVLEYLNNSSAIVVNNNLPGTKCIILICFIKLQTPIWHNQKMIINYKKPQNSGLFGENVIPQANNNLEVHNDNIMYYHRGSNIKSKIFSLWYYVLANSIIFPKVKVS